MNSKIKLMLLGIAFLASCSNRDYGYNEKSADNFLAVMERLDEAHEKLTDNRYKPGMDTTKNTDWTDLKTRIEYIDTKAKETSKLIHSEKADAYHAQILKYFDNVKTGYFGMLGKYLLSKDSAEQASYWDQLIEIRKDLTMEENKSLEIQKKFLDDAGISHGGN